MHQLIAGVTTDLNVNIICHIQAKRTNTVVDIYTKKIVQGKFKRELQTEGRGMGE